jgi:hypothetical protein
VSNALDWLINRSPLNGTIMTAAILAMYAYFITAQLTEPLWAKENP